MTYYGYSGRLAPGESHISVLAPDSVGGAYVNGFPRVVCALFVELLVKVLLAGALSILPTILYLATEVLREAGGGAAGGGGGAEAGEAGVLVLQCAADCKPVRAHAETRDQHARLLQSTLAKLVEQVKSGK